LVETGTHGPIGGFPNSKDKLENEDDWGKLNTSFTRTKSTWKKTMLLKGVQTGGECDNGIRGGKKGFPESGGELAGVPMLEE